MGKYNCSMDWIIFLSVTFISHWWYWHKLFLFYFQKLFNFMERNTNLWLLRIWNYRFFLDLQLKGCSKLWKLYTNNGKLFTKNCKFIFFRRYNRLNRMILLFWFLRFLESVHNNLVEKIRSHIGGQVLHPTHLRKSSERVTYNMNKWLI